MLVALWGPKCSITESHKGQCHGDAAFSEARAHCHQQEAGVCFRASREVFVCYKLGQEVILALCFGRGLSILYSAALGFHNLINNAYRFHLFIITSHFPLL